ncbi:MULTISPECIES: flagellar biosynthetic protein FliR [unclassified Caballeronia]|uniref:flagellar biosynthetic protein FliR n=1 Tax=unclassified Caballeronia TaxID=2646786 RepID=UPI002028913A|nr:MULTISPECIES: flagellar biosynthetic protein FliR [unclassified Caballeronia]MDR5772864.1 flagellar biosynthetic protein FliR [Caballeronia sp. LZ002]MDR5803677.1 flagellar biosynthetic protein FliR [Caballeronia sp. LZ001]MDR5848298.1 flagellar biosynthetic protein FliR [Caballeronia sp. LZ003]
MFSVTYAQLNGWLTAFLWPFVRILALMATAPVLNHMALPTRVKIALAAFITLIVAPTLPAMPDATVFSAAGVWIIVNQFLIGAAIGMTMQIAFAAVDAAGEFIGQQMGLGFAMLYDPRAGGNAVVVSRYLNTLAMLAFLVFDGHLQLIAALITTFQSVPVDVNVVASASHAQGWRVMVGYGASVFSTGLLLSLPVVAALLIANLALGILNRAAPQIGIFQVGFPVTMLVGLLLLQLMVPNLMPFFQRIFEAGLGQVGRIAGSMGP